MHDLPWLSGHANPVFKSRQAAEEGFVPLQEGRVSMEHRADILKRAEPRICAFDIETTKLPLQFPNAEHDQVMLLPLLKGNDPFWEAMNEEQAVS